MNEIEKFFSELPSENKGAADVFDEKKPTEQVAEVPTTPEEEGEEPRKNRRHRRLEEQLQRERESNIALAERIKVLSEVEQYNRPTENSDIPNEWIALYGDTPEAQKAWKMQERLLQGYTQQAKDEALREFEARQQQVIEEQQQYEALIDSHLENIEDNYNIDLTSDAPKARKARREFLEMVQKLSPKSEDGTITDYADFNSTFEIYQQNLIPEKDKSPEIVARQKEISSRSMQRPAAPGSAQLQNPTPGFRGWMKDYNIDG